MKTSEVGTCIIFLPKKCRSKERVYLYSFVLEMTQNVCPGALETTIYCSLNDKYEEVSSLDKH